MCLSWSEVQFIHVDIETPGIEILLLLKSKLTQGEDTSTLTKAVFKSQHSPSEGLEIKQLDQLLCILWAQPASGFTLCIPTR